MTRVTLTTPNAPGAVAILQLQGDNAVGVLRQLTGRDDWPQRRALRCRFAGIDEGLAVVLNPHAAQLMPHGGPRVVQKLIAYLTSELRCAYDAKPDTLALYPEAASPIEADMLDALARAASPAAIDLLAAQPALWRSLLQHAGAQAIDGHREQIRQRSATLDRLITPPTVVVVGPANVGKSTLTNALMGRALSIVADLPGTTRDWVGGLVELSAGSSNESAVAVHWLDTPGLRASDDAIEQRAIELAKQQIEQADVLLAMRDREQPWPDTSALTRLPDLWVLNKADDADDQPANDAGQSADQPLSISAAQGNNLDTLQSRVIHRLGLMQVAAEPWAFCRALKAWCVGEDLPPGYLD